VFTVPHELNVLALDSQRLFYDLLFTASAQTLLEVAAQLKHLGAQIGVISILHTWGQNLLPRPHIHCAVPAGGLSPDHRGSSVGSCAGCTANTGWFTSSRPSETPGRSCVTWADTRIASPSPTTGCWHLMASA
jgi:hypothetical protein